VRHHLACLLPAEVGPYLGHRLQLAGCSAPLFDDPAAEALWEASRGLPRLVNRLAHFALTAAAIRGRPRVSASDLAQARQEVCP